MMGSLMRRNLVRNFSSYIHLQHHQAIMSGKGQLFSYDNPRYFKKDKQIIKVALGKRGRQHIEEIRFDEFRRGMIKPLAQKKEQIQDKEEEEIVAPHYFSHYYPRSTCVISSVRRKSQYNYKVKLLEPNEALTKNIDWENLQKYSHRHIVQFALKLRHDSEKDLNKWYKVQKRLQKHIQNLSTDEMIQYKYSLGGGRKKYGRPETHKMLSDILMQQMNTMDLQQLIALYCALCRDNYTKQQKVIDLIMQSPQKLKQLQSSTQNVINFVDAYANYLADRHRKKLQVRVHNEYGKRDTQIMSKLNLVKHMIQMPINDIIRMMRCFHKLRLVGIHQQMIIANTKLAAQLQSLDYYQAYDVVYCLQKLDSGDALNMDIFTQLLPKIKQNWDKYETLEKLRIIYSYWNVGMDDLKSLYYSIPIREDSSQLYYQCMLNMGWFDKERTIQLAKTMSQLEYIPMQYHYRMRQFYHYAEGLLPNDLEGLGGKFWNTDQYFTPWHLYESYTHNEDIVEFGKYLSTLALDIVAMYPLKNTQMVQYALLAPQIAVQVIPEQAFLPNGQARRSTMLRAASFHGMRWWHIGVRWKVFKEMNRDDQANWLKQAFDRARIYQQQRLIGKREDQQEQYEQRLSFRPLSFFPHKFFEDVLNMKPLWNPKNAQPPEPEYVVSNIHQLQQHVPEEEVEVIKDLNEYMMSQYEMKMKHAEVYNKTYEEQALEYYKGKKERAAQRKAKRKALKEKK